MFSETLQFYVYWSYVIWESTPFEQCRPTQNIQCESEAQFFHLSAEMITKKEKIEFNSE